MYSQQFILRFFVSIKSLKYSKGTGFWIFNNSLISNNDFVEEINFFVHNAKLFLEQNISFSNQSKWEFFKYETRKKCLFFKSLAQKSR